MSIASRSPLNISETVGDRGSDPKDHQLKWHMGYQMITWSQTRDPNTLRAKYIENSWRCYL